MQKYYLKITTLSPVHIGTGEVYEPTNFVIDNGYLYEFDEIMFYKALSKEKQRVFVQLIEERRKEGNELFENIHKFILDNRTTAIQVAHRKVKVSKKFEEKYKEDIAKKVQIEGSKGEKKVFNKFEIQKTQRLKNSVLTYIPGSSFKGAISTAYQEMIFKESGKKALDTFIEQKSFKNLSISDTVYNKSDSKISFSKNIDLFDNDGVTLSTMIEVILPKSEFLVTLDIKDLKDDDGNKIEEKITKEKIIKACRNHYKLLFEEKQEKQLNLKENQFVISVGKHSGARAVTIDGLRKILVKLCEIKNKKGEEHSDKKQEKKVDRLYKKSHFESSKIKELFTDFKLLDCKKEKRDFQNARHFIEDPSKLEQLVRNRQKVVINAILTQETTIWKFDDDASLSSFGWVLCEFIDRNKFEELSKEYKKYEEKINKESLENIQKIKEIIKQEKIKQKELQKQKELEKQKRVEEERRQKEADFQKAKTTDDVEFLETFIKKYANEDLDFFKERLEKLKIEQKKNKLLALEHKAQKAFDEVVKKRGTKGFKKAKEKFIKKWSKEKENKGSQKILELVTKLEKIKG